MQEDLQVAVIGGGMVGISLCALLTGNGVRTLLYVRNGVQEKTKMYQNILSELQTDGLLTKADKECCETYFQAVTSYEELNDIKIALECVKEQIQDKKSVFRNLKEYCPKLQVAASATSSFSSEELAECSGMREKVIVAHPFYPPHLVPCVEVVSNSYTSKKALETLIDLLKHLKREIVLLKRDVPGFVANRLQYAMLREAIYIVSEGICTPEDVDRTLKYSFAPRYTLIGLFEHFDNCGLDLTEKVCDRLYPDLSNAAVSQNYIIEKCREGKYGIKSGKGSYDWTDRDLADFQKRVKQPYLNFFSWNVPRKAYKKKCSNFQDLSEIAETQGKEGKR